MKGTDSILDHSMVTNVIDPVPCLVHQADNDVASLMTGSAFIDPFHSMAAQVTEDDMHARDIMTRNVVSVTPAEPITQAAHTLTQCGFTAMPVVDDVGELIGIVSEADLIRDRFPDDPSGSPAGMTVGDVMTSPVVGVSHDADVTVVARAMLTAHRRCLPIVDGTTLVGIITRRDIVRALARSDADIALEVRRRLQVLGGQSRWSIQVSNGDVVVRDQFHDASDRIVAQMLAESVIGVIRATVATPSEAEDVEEEAVQG